MLSALVTGFLIKRGLVISCTTGITEPTDGEKTRSADTKELVDAETPADVEVSADTETSADAETPADVKEKVDTGGKELANIVELVVIHYKH